MVLMMRLEVQAMVVSTGVLVMVCMVKKINKEEERAVDRQG